MGCSHKRIWCKSPENAVISGDARDVGFAGNRLHVGFVSVMLPGIGRWHLLTDTQACKAAERQEARFSRLWGRDMYQGFFFKPRFVTSLASWFVWVIRHAWRRLSGVREAPNLARVEFQKFAETIGLSIGGALSLQPILSK
ncbi:hypothetical protein Tco_0438354 [Tanacetum coccineum]